MQILVHLFISAALKLPQTMLRVNTRYEAGSQGSYVWTIKFNRSVDMMRSMKNCVNYTHACTLVQIISRDPRLLTWHVYVCHILCTNLTTDSMPSESWRKTKIVDKKEKVWSSQHMPIPPFPICTSPALPQDP